MHQEKIKYYQSSIYESCYDYAIYDIVFIFSEEEEEYEAENIVFGIKLPNHSTQSFYPFLHRRVRRKKINNTIS